MTTAAQPHSGRGFQRLLEQCAVLDLDDLRPSPAERLEQALGSDLARLLRVALAGEHRSGWRRFAD